MKRANLAITLLLALCSPTQAVESSLKQQYLHYDAQSFNNRLPKDAIVFYAPVGSQGEMGNTEKCGSYICIRIDPNYNKAPRVATMTLLHEMCHVDTMGTELGPHGAMWQACMYRLAATGVFADLW